MKLLGSENTCSMGEVCYLEDFTPDFTEDGDANKYPDLTRELAAIVEDSVLHDRKMLIANVSAPQAKNKELIKALKANAFKKVGVYFGNSECFVHVYIRGLRAAKK